MSLFSHRPPADVRRRLALPSGDALLVAVRLPDDRWAVASRHGLHLVPAVGDVAHVPWSTIERGTLDTATHTLTVHWVTGATAALELPEDADGKAFARTFRERVQQSVVHTTSVSVPGGGQVQVALRRTAEGELFTQVLGGSRVDLDDRRVLEAIDQAEARVREAAGLRDVLRRDDSPHPDGP
ncbi:MAG: hypothetical protein B7X41_12575 [Microbacterium sp. 14-71-5]|jgi:hypothetical protein|nr:MAG: hypothetical protein B7X41_12575 [Microbacterium sp. 14-71-5]